MEFQSAELSILWIFFFELSKQSGISVCGMYPLNYEKLCVELSKQSGISVCEMYPLNYEKLFVELSKQSGILDWFSPLSAVH